MKWFLGAILLLLAALVLQSGLLAYAMYVLLAVMITSRLLARNWLGKVTASRTCDRLTAEIGEEVEVEITIGNSGWLPVPWVLLEDMLPRPALAQRPPRLRVQGKRLQIRMLPAGKEVALRYEIRCNMRGYYQIGPLVMESGDLFGLHRRYRVDAEPHFLLVYPKVVPLAGYDLASRRPIGDVRLSHRLYEDPTRIAGVRPYELGDPLNRVHWRATARTGTLHSKIYEPSSLAGATLLLDFHQAGYHRRGEPQRSELAITAAASLAHAVFQLGQQIGLVSNGRDAADRIRLEGWGSEKGTVPLGREGQSPFPNKPDFRTRQAARQRSTMAERSDRLQPLIVPTGRGVQQFQQIREVLARLELTDGLSAAQLIVETASRLPRDATVVALLPDVPVEVALALGTLRRQGLAVSAVLIALGEEQLEKSYGRLLAEGIMDIRHLRNEAGLPDLCQQQVRRAAVYNVEVDLSV
jgi:uncharacterized protein (DUF58 family)